MQDENFGRVINIQNMLASPPKNLSSNETSTTKAGKALIMEPRTIRHQERVVDLFYLLFRRTGA